MSTVFWHLFTRKVTKDLDKTAKWGEKFLKARIRKLYHGGKRDYKGKSSEN